MSTWDTAVSSMAALIAALTAVMGVLVVVWIEYRKNTAIREDVDAIRRTFVIRHWLLLSVGTAGLVAMLSVAVLPLSNVSVLVCAVGALVAAVCASALLLMEIAGVLSKHVWAALELQAKGQLELTQRVVSVLEASHARAQSTIDRPLS